MLFPWIDNFHVQKIVPRTDNLNKIVKYLKESWSKTLKPCSVLFHLYKLIKAHTSIFYKRIDGAFFLAIFLKYFLPKPYTSISNKWLNYPTEHISCHQSNKLVEKKYFSFLATFKLLTFKLKTFKFSFVELLVFYQSYYAKTKGKLRCT